MNDANKMLRAIINGQSALKEELLKKIDRLDRKLRQDFGKRFDILEKKVDENTGRLDKIGKQVAFLEEDAPTKGL